HDLRQLSVSLNVTIVRDEIVSHEVKVVRGRLFSLDPGGEGLKALSVTVQFAVNRGPFRDSSYKSSKNMTDTIDSLALTGVSDELSIRTRNETAVSVQFLLEYSPLEVDILHPLYRMRQHRSLQTELVSPAP